jgi:hypothetical protein
MMIELLTEKIFEIMSLKLKYTVYSMILFVMMTTAVFSQQNHNMNDRKNPIHGGKKWFQDQRKTMINHIETKEFDKIYHHVYLNDSSENGVQRYNLLMIWEQELLLLVKGKFRALLNSIDFNERVYFQERNNRSYLIGWRYKSPPFEFAEQSYLDEFNTALLNYILFNSHKIKEQIQSYNLNNAEKAFLSYYLHLNIYYLDTCKGVHKDKALEEASYFMKKFKYSKYISIVEKYTGHRKEMSDWGLEWTVGLVGGYFHRNSSLSDHANNFLIFFPMSFALNYNNLFMNIQGSYVSFPFQYDGLKKWDVNTGMFGGNGQITLGYSFHIPNSKLTISPFIGSNGFYLEGYMSEKTTADVEDKHSESFPMRSRSRIIGVNFDINFNKTESCYEKRYQDRGFVRFQVGYSSFSTNIGSSLLESDMVMFNVLLGIQSQRERRTPLL